MTDVLCTKHAEPYNAVIRDIANHVLLGVEAETNPKKILPVLSADKLIKGISLQKILPLKKPKPKSGKSKKTGGGIFDKLRIGKGGRS